VTHLDVLGTAQDGGVPHLGCRCARCGAARDGTGPVRHPTALALATPEGRQLFDAPPDLRHQTPGTDLAGVFLTHEHLGHLPGLLALGTEALDADALPVRCPPGLAELIRAAPPLADLLARGQIELRPLAPGETVRVGGVSVTPFAVPHRTEHAPTVGYELAGERTVAFVPDADRWDEATVARIAAADAALVDGSFYRPDEIDRADEVPHPPMTASMDRLDPARTAIRFVHCNHTNPALDPDSAARRAVEARGFTVAERGERIPL
jgi:pyrroloquinoline quinone biosynthesis protein B